MIEITNLSFQYKQRTALRDVSLQILKGEIFGLLGPNGSGKTTLLRILATLIEPPGGSVKMDGLLLTQNLNEIRKRIGVVFQAPSIDLKLTVFENLHHYGLLFGLSGRSLKEICDRMLERFGLSGRRNETCERLSGGLKRRVELAKSMLHRPSVLLLDEPSTGLDPGARLDVWKYLNQIRREDKVTIVAATHLMEEAEDCDRLGIMSEGKMIALGTPKDLKKEVGNDVLVVSAKNPTALAREIEKKYQIPVRIVENAIQLEPEKGPRFIPELVEAFPGMVESVVFRHPTLEDVFVHKTGRQFRDNPQANGQAKK